MSHADFIPRPDAEFNLYFKNISTYVSLKTTGTPAEWTHIPADAKTAFSKAYADWYSAYALTFQPHIPQITREKNRVRVVTERALRAFINRFLRWPPVTDLDRDHMGIPNHDTIRTPQPVPTTFPEIEVSTAILRELSLRVRDFGAAHWGKPDHVHGIELAWGIMDARPTHVSELPHFETATSNPITLPFEEEERGKRVYFAGRWVNNTSQHGPWSDIESAIVP